MVKGKIVILGIVVLVFIVLTSSFFVGSGGVSNSSTTYTATTETTCSLIPETEEICYTDYCVDYDTYEENDTIYCADMRENYCKTNTIYQEQCTTYESKGQINYYNGSEYLPIDKTIIVSSNPLFDYEVTKGIYQSYFKSNPTSGQVVKFIKNDTEITFQPMALNYRNDLSQLQQINMIQNVVGVPNGSSFLYRDAYGSGIDLRYKYTNQFLKEDLIIDSFNDLIIPAQYIQDGGNPTLDLDFVLTTNSQHIIIEGVEWDKLTTKETSNEVYIKDDLGNILYYFNTPYAYDSNGSFQLLKYQFKKSGSKLYVTLKTPYSWLEYAIYPIYIDPTIWVYQESSNTVLCTGNWGSGGETCAMTYDGDWSTWGRSKIGPNSYVYFNYSKPSGASNLSLWQVKDDDGVFNLTIDIDCWNRNPIEFRNTNVFDSQVIWDCYDGASWINLRTRAGTYGYTYEEAMFWNQSNKNNLTITGCTILNVDNGIYYLENDIINSTTSNCMDITANNVTLDCQGNTIDGDGGADRGIQIDRSTQETSNVTIKNCILTDWDTWGIEFDRADGNYILNTSVNNGDRGLSLSESKYNKIENSSLLNNTVYDFHTKTYGTFYFNSYPIYCNNELIDVNGTDNKPIVFFNYTVNLQDWNNNVSSLILCNADNSTINNLVVDHTDMQNSYGLQLIHTNNATITNSQFTDMFVGVLVMSFSDSNTLINITSNSNDGYGLNIYNAHSNNLTNITTELNGNNGVNIHLSDFNILTDITSNLNDGSGIGIDHEAFNNTIKDSTFWNNTDYGIEFYRTSPSGNLIYNNLFNNTINIKIPISGSNLWNTTKQTGTRIYSSGTQIGGNYYTNFLGTGYSDTCTDADKDGFCDSSYTLNASNIDYLPLSDEYITKVSVSQPFTTSNLIDKLTSLFRNPSQILNINLVLDRITSLAKSVTQSFTTGFFVERTRLIIRTISQQIDIFPLANKTYDFTGVFSSRAFKNTVANKPPTSLTPAGETEMNYTEINASDDDYATTTSSTERPYHKFNMSIEETSTDYLDVLWEGHTSSEGNLSLFVWNYTSTNWTLLDYGNGTSDFSLTAKITNLNDFRVGNGNITFLVQD